MSVEHTIATTSVYFFCAVVLSTAGLAVLVMGLRSGLPVPFLGLMAFSSLASGFVVKSVEAALIFQDRSMSARAVALQLPALTLWAAGCLLLSIWMITVFASEVRGRRGNGSHEIESE